MTEEERDLIKGLVVGIHGRAISKEEFVRRYPYDLQDGGYHVMGLIEEAYQKKDDGELWRALLIGFNFGFAKECIPILHNLLSEDWHTSHEDIAELLQDFKDPSSVDVLYQTTYAKYDYLAYDDSYALAVKCIWALGDINTEYSREKLKKLTQSSNRIIKENAEKQLRRTFA